MFLPDSTENISLYQWNLSHPFMYDAEEPIMAEMILCHSCVLLSERKYLAAFVPLLNQLPEGQSHVVGQSF